MLWLSPLYTYWNQPSQYLYFSWRQLWRKLHLLRGWRKWNNCTLWILLWGIWWTRLVSPCYWSWVWDMRLNWPKFLFTKHSLTLGLNAQNLVGASWGTIPCYWWIFIFQFFHENLMALSKYLWQALFPPQLIFFERAQSLSLFELQKFYLRQIYSINNQ